MKWIDNMSDKIKTTIRSWLQIQNTSPYMIQIQELADFELNAIRNRIWYRGDSNELDQLYAQCQEFADRHKFWASRSTPGMEIRKIHTGLPALMVNVLVKIVLADLNDLEFDAPRHALIWEDINQDDDFNFSKLLEGALKDVMVVGDGAFRLTIDTTISPYPMLDWVPGERVEIIRKKGRLSEVVFRSDLGGGVVLCEHYGKGYIRHKMYKNEVEVDIKSSKYAEDYADYTFDKSLILAVPFSVSESAKYQGRGGSLFDGKLDAFDSLDEAWSQWMDALRAGRAKTYIPESLLPRNHNTGEVLRPNPFDNRYIKTDADMGESADNEITTQQPGIPHDSYMASYITALDLCLQGIISPSTLGIDTKKLDNAEAQREKEKTTLYTRNAIIDALQDALPRLIKAVINAYNVLNRQAIEDVKVSVPFGEYANPSFESQVETVGKGKTQGIMSIEACVDELYGDSKEEAWKQEEVARLKAEQGITEVEEQAVNMSAGGFEVSGDKPVKEPTMYEITSILGKRAKGTLTLNNARSMLLRIGVDEEEAETLLNDKD